MTAPEDLYKIHSSHLWHSGEKRRDKDGLIGMKKNLLIRGPVQQNAVAFGSFFWEYAVVGSYKTTSDSCIHNFALCTVGWLQSTDLM